MIKGTLFSVALAVAVAGLQFTDVLASTQKITYCHVPAGNPGNAHTITTSIRSAMRPGHALVDINGNEIEIGGHGGDYLGECKKSAKVSTVSVDQKEDKKNPVLAVTELPRTGNKSTALKALAAAALAWAAAEVVLRGKETLRRRTEQL